MALIKCPECGKEFSSMADKCPNCGMPNACRIETTYVENHSSKKKNQGGMKSCPVCGNYLSGNATQCPQCGNVFKKKSSKHGIIDSICILSLVVTTFMCILGFWMQGYAINLFWLIVYYLMYESAKKNDDIDESEVKRSMYTIFIFFLLQFGIIIVF